MPEQQQSQQKKERSAIGTVLGIVAFTIIIIVGLWGAVNAVRLVPNVFSGIVHWFGGEPELTLSLNQTSIDSGGTVSLTWEHEATEGGYYAVVYSCRDGVTFAAQTSAEGFSNFPCGSSWSVPAASAHTLTLRGTSDVTSATPVVLSVTYVNDENEEGSQDSATVTVAAGKTQEPTNGGSNGGGTNGGSQTPSEPKIADLSVRVLSLGYIDGTTGTFVAAQSVHSSQIAAIRFQIENVGTAATGKQWRFRASLPTETPFTYQSDLQPRLEPGDGLTYTLRFNQLKSGTSQLSIYADSDNVITEKSEVNNLAQYNVTVSY